MNNSTLQNVIEGSTDYKCRAYSGRGMYGAKCLSVDVGRGELGELMAAIIENTSPEDTHEVARAVRRLCTDSMGMGTIVYFPGTPCTTEPSDDEE